MMIMILAFLAFTVDVGFIALTKAQMKGCSDAAALSGSQELIPLFKPGATLTYGLAQDNAGLAAEDIATYHRSGDHKQAYLERSRDVKFGQYYQDENSGAMVKQYDVWPANFVEVTTRRDQPLGQGETAGTGSPDSSLPLFFAPALGTRSADLRVRSTAAMLPGIGFRKPPGNGQTVDILPIALDIETWEDLLAGVGDDNFSYNEQTKQVSSGTDGILEVNLYPTGDGSLPPGNRGTVDIGGANNSTNDLKRQILYGISREDFDELGFELRFDQQCILNGDTGLSAGIKAQLEAIIGQPRAIPLFSDVSGPGNNANYTIEKFVGIRILEVKLTGSPKKKRVIVQPCEFVSSYVIPGPGTIQVDSILTTPRLIE
nr:Tad domain-containing protein [Thalassoroseus pseudoceratinae]